MLLPLLALAFFAARPDIFPAAPLLAQPSYVRHIWLSIALMAGAGGLALILGAAAGWCVAALRFPGRRVFSYALVLPLALPPYITAYVYAELLEANASALPIRSLAGAIFVMGVALYPYVYLAARLAFTREARAAMLAAQSLGASQWLSFRRAALPAARPALAAGSALVLMECLNDIGVMEHLGVRTLTVALYDVWLVRGDFAIATRLALLLLAFAFALIALERALRGRRRYHAPRRAASRSPVSPAAAASAFVICLLPVFFGFLLPAATLIAMAQSHWAVQPPASAAVLSLSGLAGYSFAAAAAAALLVSFCGLILAYFTRLLPRWRPIASLAALGYALPGGVLALGIVAVFALWNQWAAFYGLVLIGGFVPLFFAYLVRFLILPYGLNEAGLSRIPLSLDHAAQILGASAAGRFFVIHAPLLRAPLAAALLLVFVDVLRELPATLILRPFNFTTLAVHIYDQASLGLFEQSAPAALALLALGFVPVLVWNWNARLSLRSRP